MIVVSLLPKWWHVATVNARKKNRIMAQSAITVRIDSGMKSQFDKLCEEFGMSAVLDDTTVVENDDLVGITNRRETVGNDEGRTTLHQ